MTQNREANGTTASSGTPTVSGLVGSPQTDGVTGLVQEFDSADAGARTLSVTAYSVNDGNDGGNYLVTTHTVAGNIYPAPAASLSFTAEPIDAEVSTPIYSICVPSGGSAPCALAGLSGSTPVQVTARDAYGNLAGKGAPGDDGTHPADVKVQIKRETNGGASLGAAVSTSNGVASFGNQLVVIVTGNNNHLFAATTSGAVSGPAPNTTSTQFRVVYDLAACDGVVCDNNASNGAAANQLQRAGGKIKTTSDFYDPGTANVILSSTFVPGTETNQAACGNNKTIGQAVDLQVTGLGAGETAPSTIMVMILPKNTIKHYGVTARSAESIKVCLGALDLDNDLTAKWKGAKPTGSGLVDSTLVGDRQWGIPTACGTAGLAASDPCIALATKQAATLRTYLLGQGWTTAQITALGMKDADIAITIRKGAPWDAKGGAY